MADTVSTSIILGIGVEYTDTETQKAKTTYLKIPNPKNNLTEQEIKDAAKLLVIGDENNTYEPLLLTSQGERFSETAILTAYREEQEIIELDIGQ